MNYDKEFWLHGMCEGKISYKMTDHHMAFTHEGIYIPQPLNHIEGLFEGWEGIPIQDEMAVCVDAHWHWHLFMEGANKYA